MIFFSRSVATLLCESEGNHRTSSVLVIKLSGRVKKNLFVQGTHWRHTSQALAHSSRPTIFDHQNSLDLSDLRILESLHTLCQISHSNNEEIRNVCISKMFNVNFQVILPAVSVSNMPLQITKSLYKGFILVGSQQRNGYSVWLAIVFFRFAPPSERDGCVLPVIFNRDETAVQCFHGKLDVETAWWIIRRFWTVVT